MEGNLGQWFALALFSLARLPERGNIMREYLEKAQKHDKKHKDNLNWLNDLGNEEYRKVKALEIIAWQLIQLNENLDSFKNILSER